MSAAVRARAGRALAALEAEQAKDRQALLRRLDALKSGYRRDLSALLGPRAVRRIADLRARLAKAPRGTRLRESAAALEALGVDRERTSRLRRAYLLEVRRVIDLGDVVVGEDLPPIHPGKCPWVVYTPPYGGSLAGSAIQPKGGPDNPVLAVHLDPSTGRIGSSIRTGVANAGNDTSLSVEVHTSLLAWHTAVESSPIEAYVALEHRRSTYSGRMTDEFGISSGACNQWARAVLRVVDPAGPTDVQESRIFSVIHTVYGGDTSWNGYAAPPGDIHYHYFRTAASFPRGALLLLEARVRNVTWFDVDDVSVTTADDLDLRLDRILVRSC